MLKSGAKGLCIQQFGDARQNTARQRHPAGRGKGDGHVSGKAGDDFPIGRDGLRRVAACIRQSGGDDGGAIHLRCHLPARQSAGFVNADETSAIHYALCGDAAKHPLQMRPEGFFFCAHRAKINMAGLGGHRYMPPVGFNQCADAKAGAGAQNQPRARAGLNLRADHMQPFGAHGGQAEGLRFKIIEQQPMRQTGCFGNLRPVHQPGGIGQL